MAIIDKSLIKSFVGFDTETTTINALNFAQSLLETAIAEIAKTNPYLSLSTQTILPVGSFYSHTVLPNSIMDLLLVVDSPQIVLNTHSLFKNKWKVFKQKLKYAWQNRKKKKKRRRKKQKCSEEQQSIKFLNPKDNYNILSLAKDLVKAISKNITVEDIVYLKNGVLVIQGQNIPFKIRIFPVIAKENLEFQFFQQSKTKILNFSIKEHHDNIESLLEHFGETFSEQVKIFSGLYQHLIGHVPNPVFIESLIANLPNVAFENEDAYENFVFSANYLLNIKPNKIFSVANPNNKIYEDMLCGTSLLELNNFLKKLVIAL